MVEVKRDYVICSFGFTILVVQLQLFVFSCILPKDYAYITPCYGDSIEINCIIHSHIVLWYKRVKPNENEISMVYGSLGL